MSSKIRIIGEFGEDILDKVQTFAESLPGVQYVSLLVNGTETMPDSAPPVADLTAAETAVPPDTVPAAPEQPSTEPAPAQ